MCNKIIIKVLYFVFSLMIFIGVFYLFTTNIFAINSKYETASMNSQREEECIEKYKLFKIEEKKNKEEFKSFDINEFGLIVLKGDSNCILIYDTIGNYQYGFSISTNQNFDVEWDGNNILVIIYRDEIMISINREGEIVEIVSVLNNEYNENLENEDIYPIIRQCKGKTYKAKNSNEFLNVFAKYTQIIELNENNEEIIIYDATEYQLPKTIFNVIIYSVIISFAFFVLIFDIKRHRNKNQFHDK